jgi:hypothetical protein
VLPTVSSLVDAIRICDARGGAALAQCLPARNAFAARLGANPLKAPGTFLVSLRPGVIQSVLEARDRELFAALATATQWVNCLTRRVGSGDARGSTCIKNSLQQ